jgi:hypothetical protein
MSCSGSRFAVGAESHESVRRPRLARCNRGPCVTGDVDAAKLASRLELGKAFSGPRLRIIALLAGCFSQVDDGERAVRVRWCDGRYNDKEKADNMAVELLGKIDRCSEAHIVGIGPV